MHTIVTLRHGKLRTVIHADKNGQRISKRRWQASIAPAISLLHHFKGDRCLYVIHNPRDLEP